jgi:hypothetical protein
MATCAMSLAADPEIEFCAIDHGENTVHPREGRKGPRACNGCETDSPSPAPIRVSSCFGGYLDGFASSIAPERSMESGEPDDHAVHLRVGAPSSTGSSSTR